MPCRPSCLPLGQIRPITHGNEPVPKKDEPAPITGPVVSFVSTAEGLSVFFTLKCHTLDTYSSKLKIGIF